MVPRTVAVRAGDVDLEDGSRARAGQEQLGTVVGRSEEPCGGARTRRLPERRQPHRRDRAVVQAGAAAGDEGQRVHAAGRHDRGRVAGRDDRARRRAGAERDARDARAVPRRRRQQRGRPRPRAGLRAHGRLAVGRHARAVALHGGLGVGPGDGGAEAAAGERHRLDPVVQRRADHRAARVRHRAVRVRAERGRRHGRRRGVAAEDRRHVVGVEAPARGHDEPERRSDEERLHLLGAALPRRGERHLARADGRGARQLPAGVDDRDLVRGGSVDVRADRDEAVTGVVRDPSGPRPRAGDRGDRRG